MLHKKSVLSVILLISFLLSGCYLNDDVNTDQVGVRLNRNKIIECVAPGVYSDWGFFSDLREVSVSTLTFQVEDPEVATSDNQLVGVRITIQVRRKNDCESVTNLLTNWSALIDDVSLTDTVSATAREAIKNGTRTFDLAGLLDDRNGLALKIGQQLEEDAAKYSADVINVTIENIALDPDYASTLQERALLTAQIDREKKRQDLINQQASNNQLEQTTRATTLSRQLEAEKAQTNVDLEIAARKGKVIAEANRVYLDNEYAFQLEQLRLLKEIFGEKSVFYFLPQDTALTTIFGLPGTTLPLPTSVYTPTTTTP